MKITILFFTVVSQFAMADELSQELDSFQVDLKSKEQREKVIRVKKPAPSTGAIEAKALAPAPQITMKEEAKPRKRESGLPFFLRMTALPYAIYSTVDGQESGSAQQGVQNQFQWSYGGQFAVDLNVFNSDQVVFETGFQYSRISLQVRTIPNSTVYPSYSNLQTGEQIIDLGYMGVPLNLKWMSGGNYSTSIYVKLGTTPSYLSSRKYRFIGYNPVIDDLYGGNNDFDLFFQGSIGVSIKLTNRMFANIEGGGYQGIIPVTKRYEMYNAGFTAGAGMAFTF